MQEALEANLDSGEELGASLKEASSPSGVWAASQASTASICGTSDAGPVAGDQDFGDCTDLTLHHWSSPITPFLNHPCDLLSRDPPGVLINDVLCRTVAAVPSAIGALLPSRR